MVKILKKRLSLLVVVLSVILLLSIVTTSVAVDSLTPDITAFAPAEGGVVNTTTSWVSFTVYDPDLISSADTDYYIKVNNEVKPATFSYKGHWETTYDSCGASYDSWVLDSYSEATIYTNVANLKDGDQTIEVMAKDQLGNPVTKTWTFKVAVPPGFTNENPYNGSTTTNSLQKISVKVTDDTKVDPASIVLTVDGLAVKHVFDEVYGIVYYTPQAPLGFGVHTAGISAKDMAGNGNGPDKPVLWSFNVHADGPQFTFAMANKTYDIYNPAIAVSLADTAGVGNQNFEMYVDDTKVTPTFTYGGHWYSDYDGDYWVADENTAFLDYKAAALADGPHKLRVKAFDKLWNANDITWNFSIGQAPVISGLEPANGRTINILPTVSASIYDPNSPPVDQASIKLLVDKEVVVPQVATNADGTVTVSYTDSALANDSYHDVSLTVADTMGNTATATSRFYALIVGQTRGFINVSPGNQTDVTTNRPMISAHLSNLGGTYDINQISLVIDGGLPVKPTVSGLDPDYNISYTPTLADGAHTVTISVYDRANPSVPAATTWGFNVKVPPVITKTAPTYSVTTGTPIISAYVTDNTEVSKAEVSIDGQTVASRFEYVQSKNYAQTTTKDYARISVQLTSPLAEGQHTTSLIVYDASGNTASTRWNFTVDTNIGQTYSDMPVGNDQTCWKCHSTIVPIPQATYSGNVGGKHPDVPQCRRCHTAGVVESRLMESCTNCHFDYQPLPGNYPHYLSYRHTSDGAFAFANIINVRHPIKDKHLSSTTGCQNCHSRILTQEHYRPGRTDKNGDPINCNTCHTGSALATESSTNNVLRIENPQVGPIAGRVWSAPPGQVFSKVYVDALMLHGMYFDIYATYPGGEGFITRVQSPSGADPTRAVSQWLDLPAPATRIRTVLFFNYNDGPYIDGAHVDIPKVKLNPTGDEFIKMQNAITNKDTSCGSCHGNNVDHEAKHVSTLNANCLGCHDANLSKEHREHPKRTNGRDLTCDSCHANNGKDIKRTIAAKSLSCEGCHTTGHINFAGNVPADISIDKGVFQWLPPMEAALFTGEAGTPAGYESGQMVLSNRVMSVTAVQVWNFYNENLKAKGWTSNSVVPAEGAQYFTAVFTKQGREVTVKCYNTLTNDFTGTSLGGFRTEVWYK